MPEKEFLTIDDLDFKGKIALVRVDINSPYDSATKKIEMNERIVEHAKTIRELLDKGSKVVVLAHQGRAGDEDFTPLEQHAQLLSKCVKRKVKYVPDILGPTAKKEIAKLKEGKAVMLENLRFLAEETLELSPEEHAKSIMVTALAPLAQAFVNDAYSAAHRSHASIVGFAEVLPSCAGRAMEREIVQNAKAIEKVEHPNIYVLGGVKPEDCIILVKHGLETNAVDKILTAGTIAKLFVLAQGSSLTKKDREDVEKEKWTGLVPELRELLSKYGGKIAVPSDFAVEENGSRKNVSTDELAKYGQETCDVGEKTVKEYVKAIGEAKSVYVKGAIGVVENPLFELGTKAVFQAVARSDAFSLTGGGSSLYAIEKFKIPKKKISHISLAGGALLTYLSGKPLPGVEALKRAAKRKASGA
jgi:phosphoglycerate kinase